MSGYYSQLRWHNKKQCCVNKAPSSIEHWLFDTGSLTAKIISCCAGSFKVHVISETRASPTPDEIKALGLRYRSQAMIRQVILYCDEKPYVYARTVIPITTLTGPLRRLANLGNKPLGEVLFADRSISRGEVEISQLKASHENYKWTQNKDHQTIWGRRSIFYQKNKKLLVSEFFMPEINQLKKNN